MKTSKRRILSLLICMSLVFTMCLAFSGSVFAANETPESVTFTPQDAATVLTNGATVPLTEVKNIASLKAYKTPLVNNTAQTFTYNVKMPKKGTLFVQYAPSVGASCYIESISGASSAGSGTADGTEYNMYYVPSASTVTFNLRVYDYNGSGFGAFAAYYAAGTKTFSSAKTDFILGSPSSTGESTFKVKVPATGYLKIKAIDAASTYSYVSLKTSSFKNWDSISSNNDYTTYIGVKKGTYTIKLKGAKLYDVKTSFTKIKETSAKTTKSSAAKLTKKKLNKGVIVVNKKKVHWYKIKNPKTQKVKVAVNAKKMSDAGAYGGLKITLYSSKGQSTSSTISAGTSNEIEYYNNYSSKKLSKGTYYLKVESQDGCNGYYTLKWK